VKRRRQWPPQRIAELELNKQILENKAKSSEIALITIGRNAGENADRNVEKFSYR
jgi:beta-glucosidase